MVAREAKSHSVLGMLALNWGLSDRLLPLKFMGSAIACPYRSQIGYPEPGQRRTLYGTPWGKVVS